MPHVPEILAPVGSDEALDAALASGADAMYLGLSEGFQARARSTAFSLPRLPELVARAHAAGVKLYLTLNTLVFERELDALEALLRGVIAAGVDALIVQDPAVALLARALCPELPLHASTQMTISSVEGARFAASLGISRVVLPRELSTKEIARFTANSPMAAEVFVHGALCMAWSGQCLTSEALSDRSANRGQCSQACRMPYGLVVDGELRELGDTRYLLSPQDLAAHEQLPELIAAGVHGLKIEGRYKSGAYVISAVDSLRHWRDALVKEQGPSAADKAQLASDLFRARLTFSRGASPGFLAGDDHQSLVQGQTPKHRGILLGEVQAVRGRNVLVSGAASLRERLRAGMGVMFQVGDPERDDAPGGPIFHVRWHGDSVELGFGDPGPDLRRVTPGTAVWLTGDPQIALEAERRAKQAGTGRIALRLQVSGGADQPLCVQARASFAARRLSAEAQSTTPLAAARGTGLDADLLRDKLAALGGTPFQLSELDTTALPAGLHLPVSELKQLRRDLITSLTQQLVSSPWRITSAEPQVPRLRPQLSAAVHGEVELLVVSHVRGVGAGMQLSAADEPGPSPAAAGETEPLVVSHVRGAGGGVQLPAAAAFVHSHEPAHGEGLASARSVVPQLTAARVVPLCRTAEQLEAVIALGVSPGDEVELDFMEFVGLGAAVRRAREAGLAVTIATLRVQKPGEEGYDRRIAALAPDAVLVRHWGALMCFAEQRTATPRVHGDFSLNITNAITARHVLGLGLDSVTASHDLDRDQLLALLEAAPRGRVAVTLHHHIPTFHNSHCVYAHLLSDGKDYRSCGRPCESHRVALRDFAGHDHPVVVDVGCRNTMFNAQAQSAAPLVPDLLTRGVQRFRVELVWETAAQVTQTLSAYRALLSGDLTPQSALKKVGVHEQYGVTLLRSRALPLSKAPQPAAR